MAIFQRTKTFRQTAHFRATASGPLRVLPKIWLMSDERLGDRLLPTIRNLPRGSGIIFRHYGLPDDRRRQLFMAARRIARQRGHIILLAGQPKLARAWGADGYHGRFGRLRFGGGSAAGLLHSVPVHSRREIALNAKDADLVFLSPIYATASHPGARPLGPIAFREMAALCQRKNRSPVIALGGMTRARFQMQHGNRVYGWAAISGLAKG